MRISLIVAADDAEAIGHGGDLPWHLPEDLRRFKRLTDGHVVVAGRRTHESILRRLGRPLPGRFTVVATRQTGLVGHGPVLYQPSVTAALSIARQIEAFAGGDEVFVIGGAEVYAQAMPAVDRVYLTRVHARVPADTHLPPGWLDPFEQVEQVRREQDGLAYSFLTYERSPVRCGGPAATDPDERNDGDAPLPPR